MPGHLAGLFESMTPRRPGRVIVNAQNERQLFDEVSEHEGMLLVRLRAGCAMQVRLRGSDVLTRTVPIAQATQIGECPPWQIASASCLQAWIQSNAAIWRWLVLKGIDVEATKTTSNETILPGHNAISV